MTLVSIVWAIGCVIAGAWWAHAIGRDNYASGQWSLQRCALGALLVACLWPVLAMVLAAVHWSERRDAR